MFKLSHGLRLTGAAMLVTLTAAACSVNGSGTANTSDKPLELVYTYDGNLGKPLKNVLTATNDLDKVKLTVAGNSYEDVLTRLAGDRTTGTLPDIAMVGLDTARTVAESGLATPVDQFLKDDTSLKAANLDAAAVNAVTFDGKMYGMPCMGTASPILYYNTAIFTAAGLDPANPPQTWSQVIAASEKIKTNSAADYGIYYDPNSYLFQSALFSGGGSIMDTDRKKLQLDSPESAGVLAYYQDLTKQGMMPAVPGAAGKDSFLQGRTAMYVTSSSGVASMSSNTKFDLRTSVYPIPDGGQRAPVLSGNTFMITATDPARQRAAWDVLSHMCSAESSATFALQTGYIPFDVTARATVQAKQPIHNAGYDQAGHLTPWFNFPGDNAVQITTAINEMVEASYAGKDIRQTLTDTSHKIEGMLP